MAIFPDDFPFNRRDDELPVVAATPLDPARTFSDDFPFTKREPQATEPVEAPDGGARWTAKPQAAGTAGSTIFAPGFPFADPPPEVVSVVEATPSVIEAAAAPVEAAPIDDAVLEMFAPSPAAPLPTAPTPAPVAPLPFKDRRRSPRQRMNAKASLRVDTLGGNPLHVEIDNLSLLGIRFRSNRELLVNDKANLRLEVGPLKWASRLRVINCQQNRDASYTIGCEFVGNELARGRAAA